MVFRIQGDSIADLLEIAQAPGSMPSGNGPLRRGKDQNGQDGDYPDDHQELNECKPTQ